MLGLQPVLDPFPDRGGAGGGRAHQVVLRTEVTGHAVVEHHAVVGAHHAVADPADLQPGPLVDVEQVQQPGHVRAAQVELADRRDVDYAHVLAHVPGLGAGVPVAVPPDPGPRHQRHTTVLVAPGLHRRVAHRLGRLTG